MICLVCVCVCVGWGGGGGGGGGGAGGGAGEEVRGIAGTLEPIIRLCSEYSRLSLLLSKLSDRVGIFCALSKIE